MKHFMVYVYKLLATASSRPRLGNQVMELHAHSVTLDAVQNMISFRRTQSDTGFTASMSLCCGESHKTMQIHAEKATKTNHDSQHFKEVYSTHIVCG